MTPTGFLLVLAISSKGTFVFVQLKLCSLKRLEKKEFPRNQKRCDIFTFEALLLMEASVLQQLNSDLSSLTRRRCRQGHKRLFSLRDTPTGLLANKQKTLAETQLVWGIPEYLRMTPKVAWARVCNHAALQHHI